MRLTLQLLASALIVLGVLYFMWRLPRRGEELSAWSPPLALGSVWAGLASLLLTALLWVLPAQDQWVTLVFLLLYPLSIGTGVLVLWLQRGLDHAAPPLAMQRVQAKVGITLGLLAVVLGYIFVMTHKAPFTPTG